jgi:hypothetical protein
MRNYCKKMLLCCIVIVNMSACVPVQVSHGCRKQMHDCMKNCQKIYVPQTIGRDRRDLRDTCERTCHDLCWKEKSL